MEKMYQLGKFIELAEGGVREYDYAPEDVAKMATASLGFRVTATNVRFADTMAGTHLWGNDSRAEAAILKTQEQISRVMGRMSVVEKALNSLTSRMERKGS